MQQDINATATVRLQAYDGRLRKADYVVIDVPLKTAQELVSKFHYCKGGSNTRTFTHGLVERATGRVVGVAWWIPPTKLAAMTVSDDWRRVLSLSRMVIAPGVPKNAATFLLAASVKAIANDGRFPHLVTYADAGEGHDGAVYKLAGWTPAGETKPEAQWVDQEGRHVARKAGRRTRTKAEMEALDYRMIGRRKKFKFVKHVGSAK